MRPTARWFALVTALSTLAAPHPVPAQVPDPIPYALFSPSDFGYGCNGPCACPWFFTGPVKGTFTLHRTGVDPLFTHYALTDIVWRYPEPGTGRPMIITGRGTYDIGGEVALMHRMQLDVTTDGALEQHFDSGLVPARGTFPAIDIDVRVHVNVCIDSVLHVVAGPQGLESVPPGAPAMRLTASPNPTRAGADVVLTLAEAEAGEVAVLNVAGGSVAVLARGTFPAGENRWHWDGRSSSGADAGAGVFWVLARLGTRTVSQRFARLR